MEKEESEIEENVITLMKGKSNKKKKKKKVIKKKNSDHSGSEENDLLDIHDGDHCIIKERYQLLKLLGSGSFGEIQLAFDSKEKDLIALKFELINSKSPQLKHEYNILEYLNKNDPNITVSSEGIPKVYAFDRIENKCNFMAMEFLGPSLGDLFQYREKIFSLSTCLLLAIQMLNRIEYLHEKGFIHRDLKPENFLMGLNENSNTLYLIDYGLSKRYKEKGTTSHIQYRENRNLIGTARYASINAHLGIEQSRRDDLESIGYLIIYFLQGKLPWQSKNEKGKDPNKIKDKKLITTPEMLCKKLPLEFSYYFHYVRSLKYQDRPDYASLKGLFYSLLVMVTKSIKEISTSNFNTVAQDYCFDWFEELEENSESYEEKNNEINNEIQERNEESCSSNEDSNKVDKFKNIEEKEINILSNLNEKKDTFLNKRLNTNPNNDKSSKSSSSSTLQADLALHESEILNKMLHQTNSKFNQDTKLEINDVSALSIIG